jgi:L-iditol 2-dehydrogenase
MKLVHLTTPETVEVKDLPARREAGPGELLLEPLIVGLSGTDALRYKRGAPTRDGFRHPHVPGSEFVARVVEVERGVHMAFQGQRVVASPVFPCFKCAWCVEGEHHLCPNARTLGEPPVHGALQQRFAWPAELCVTVPQSIPDHLAVLVVPIANSLHILDLAELRTMDAVAVIGCGHQGLLLVQALRSAGAGEIIAVDLEEYRRKAALEFGATHAVDPIGAEELVRRLPRRGVDIAIDVSNGPEASRNAVAMTRAGGRVLLAGSPADNRILFGAQDARRKELLIQFVRRPHNTYKRAVAMIKSGMLKNLDRLITHRYELHQVAEAFRTVRHMREEVIKAIIVMPRYQPREESPQAIHSAIQQEEAIKKAQNAPEMLGE